MPPCRLYLISPPSIDLAVFAKSLENAFSGGDVGSFQLRLKNASDNEIMEAARALIPICHAHDAAFIMNDRADLAALCNADGVHIGQEDLSTLSRRERGGASLGEGPVSVASKGPHPNPLPEGEGISAMAAIRSIVGPDRVIGVSCHDSKHLAMEAGEHGADYVAFGAFYPTKSKSPEALAKYGTPMPDILEWWQAFMVLPCVAIGGITPSNCQPLVKAGADFIAAITAVWEHPEGPGKAVEEFNKGMTR